MTRFNTLGFYWDSASLPADVPTYSIDRVCFRFHRMLAGYIWDASSLEGNPLTFSEVKTLLDGVTVGGHKLIDQEQVLNLAGGAKLLSAQIKTGQFVLSKAGFTNLHGVVARNIAPEWGLFRGEGQLVSHTPYIALGSHGRHTPLPTVRGAAELNGVFFDGLATLMEYPPFERATAFFLFGALQQFFFAANKCTSRLVMNGILMSHGMDAISVPAARAQEFNEKMARFYLSKNGTEVMAFLINCHPEAAQIYAANSNIRSKLPNN